MIANELTLQSLRALAQGEILAVCIPHFLASNECSDIASATVKSAHFKFNGPGFVGLGPGCFNLPYAVNEYAKSASEIERMLATPYQKLVTSLGHLERPVYDGVTLRPLTSRFYDTFFRLPPYQDESRPTYPWAVECQLAISLGLVSPESGGRIRLWNFAYNAGDYTRRRLPCRIGLEDDLVPPHDLEIDCEVGKLTILNARRLHAIDRIESGARISVDGYVSQSGSATYLWS